MGEDTMMFCNSLQVSFRILLLMQNTDNVQAISAVLKIHHMRPAQILLKIRQHPGGAAALCSCG